MRNTWGTKREASPGVWELRYTIPGVRRESKTIRGSEKDADDYLAVLRVRYKVNDGYIEGIPLDFIWKQFYLPSLEGLAPSTVVGYKRHYEHNIAPVFGDRVMTGIQKFEIQTWIDGLSYGAARSGLAVLRQVFNFAEDEGLIDDNVTRKRYKLPRKSPETTKRKSSSAIYSEDEMLSILHDCKGEHWEAAYILAAGGGLRRGEAFGPKLDEIDFVTYKGQGFALVEVRRSVQVIDGAVEVIERTKTPSSEDTIAIPEPYSTRLHEIVMEREGDIWLTDDGFGMPSNPDTLTGAYRRWFSSVKHTYIPFENLRNSYSTMLHSKGVDSGMVSKMLRHSTGGNEGNQTDYKHYFRPTAEHYMQVFIDISRRSGKPETPIIRIIPGRQRRDLGDAAP